ncbi:MAG: glycosyltransferase family 4 protein [bacterium]|nr:glycosyltransferase family 4 protein [bacterium]
MKLVWVAQDLHKGGGERVIIELSARLAKRNHDVQIIYPRGRGGFAIPPGVAARQVGFEIASPMVSLVMNLPALIAAVPPCDWVLCSMPISVLAGYFAGQLRNARVLSYVMTDERMHFDDRVSIKSNFSLEFYHIATDLVQRLPATFVANSRWTATRIRRGRGVECPIVPSGVDPNVFTPAGPRHITDDLFTIVVVGRKTRWKGLAELIEALNRIFLNQGDLPSFQLWIITQEVLDLSTTKFPYRIFRPDGDRDIAAILRSADLLVHPSWFEGFGLPPLEAMACGTPVIISDCGGIRDYARHGHNCLLFTPRDVPALIRTITTLMQDGDLRRKFAQTGPETAAGFTWDYVTDAFEEVLTQPR